MSWSPGSSTFRHVQQAGEKRQRCRQRMLDVDGLSSSPLAGRELRAALVQVCDGGIDLGQQKLPPVGVVRGEQVHRALVYEQPQGNFELCGHGGWRAGRETQSAQHHRPHRLFDALVKGTHQPITHRINAGASIPIHDQLFELRRSG